MNENLFFELLQVAIGQKNTLNHTPSDKEWLQLFNLSQIQAVAGSAFDAPKRAPKWMLKLRLEWLYRLCHEPKKQWAKNKDIPKVLPRIYREEINRKKQIISHNSDVN